MVQMLDPFSQIPLPGRQDLLGSIVFGGAKREGTAAVVVGAGLVVDTHALLLWAERLRIRTVGSRRA